MSNINYYSLYFLAEKDGNLFIGRNSISGAATPTHHNFPPNKIYIHDFAHGFECTTVHPLILTRRKLCVSFRQVFFYTLVPKRKTPKK